MMGLFDFEFKMDDIKKHQPPLQKLNKVIDWEIFRPILESELLNKSKVKGGRPPFDKLLMFKIIILQRYFNISDDQTEFQIKDRLSFMDFLNLELSDKIPDAKTIWFFKDQLCKKGLTEKLFDLFTVTLNSKGIIAKEGSMVDASFVDVPKQRNNREDNAIIKKGAVPISLAKNKNKLAQKDTDARWITKNNERHFGYKNHINADKKTKLINNYSVTNASTHDSVELENLVNETDNILYADSAYRSEHIETHLKEIKCTSEIHEKAYRNKPLSENQKKNNAGKSKIRGRVEHIFGFMTNSMNDALHLRQIGQQRIATTIGFVNLTYNLFRFEQLMRLNKA